MQSLYKHHLNFTTAVHGWYNYSYFTNLKTWVSERSHCLKTAQITIFRIAVKLLLNSLELSTVIPCCQQGGGLHAVSWWPGMLDVECSVSDIFRTFWPHGQRQLCDSSSWAQLYVAGRPSGFDSQGIIIHSALRGVASRLISRKVGGYLRVDQFVIMELLRQRAPGRAEVKLGTEGSICLSAPLVHLSNALSWACDFLVITCNCGKMLAELRRGLCQGW